MARAYSDDLRCKFLAAYERGAGTLRQLSGSFAVSLAYAKKIRQQLLRTGRVERVPQSRYGRPSRITPEVENWLRIRLRAAPDATLAELRQGLADEFNVPISRSHLARLLQRMQLRLKKSRFTPASRTAPKGSGKGRHGGSR
jgi:transposase